VVIEATTPASRESRHESWESMLTGQGYAFAWFDGLNRYYVAEEHVELAAVLNVQPNVFDAFITHHLDKAWRDAENAHRNAGTLQQRLEAESALRWQSDQRLDQERALVHEALAHARQLADDLNRAHEGEQRLREHLRQREEELTQLLHDTERTLGEQLRHTEQTLGEQLRHTEQCWAAESADLTARLDQAARDGYAAAQWAHELDTRLNATLRSMSWRVTAPLRAIGKLLRRAGSTPAAGRRHLRTAVTRLTANERLRRLIIPVLVRFPALGKRVASTLQTIKQPAPSEQPGGAGVPVDAPALPPEIKALPASARRIAADVQSALGLEHGN